MKSIYRAEVAEVCLGEEDDEYIVRGGLCDNEESFDMDGLLDLLTYEIDELKKFKMKMHKKILRNE